MNGAANLGMASILGVEVDFGTFNSPSSNRVYADAVNFSIGGNTGNANFEVTNQGSVVPEPSTYALMAAGLAGLGLVARRRKHSRNT